MLLAVDTSTRFASIALVAEPPTEPARLLAELNWDAGQHHSRELFTRLEWLLMSQGATPNDLTAVAVATGPGSFNGLRVAVTAAKSLCYALQLPLYACPTLDVIGWGYAGGRAMPGGFWALLDAGRGQVYAASYAGSSPGQPFAPEDGYHILTPRELAERVLARSESSVLFGGEWLPATRAALADSLGERAVFADAVSSRRASWLAELAIQQAGRGETVDIMALEPLYLRRPAISRSSRLELDGAGLAQSDESRWAREETSHALRR